MRVLLAFNEPVLAPTHSEADSEHEILDVVASVIDHLRELNIEVHTVGIGRDLAAIRKPLRTWRPDVVLNLFEGFADDPTSECRFANLLENEGVPFTGCSAETLWQAGRKDIAKQIFRHADLPTPAWMLIEHLPPLACNLNYPLIVKPAFHDASEGIHQSSVVTGRALLENQVANIATKYGLPVLVEEFIAGREISTALFDGPEPVVLPLVETIFNQDNGCWPMGTYNAKWQPGSPDYLTRELHYPADLPPKLVDCIRKIAKRAYRLFDCRGLVTLDFRLHNNIPYLLEINPNADLKPSSCLTDLLHFAGTNYTEFLLQLLQTTGHINNNPGQQSNRQEHGERQGTFLFGT
jgi:D-alanine-D-alanine ligase